VILSYVKGPFGIIREKSEGIYNKKEGKNIRYIRILTRQIENKPNNTL
jgi:hypothetical protein